MECKAMSWLSATFWQAGAKGSKGGVKIWMDDEHPMEVSTFAREHFGT